MQTAASILSAHAAEAARDVARHFDAEPHIPQLEGLVHGFSEALQSGSPRPGPSPGGPILAPRLVHAAAWACVEILRGELDAESFVRAVDVIRQSAAEAASARGAGAEAIETYHHFLANSAENRTLSSALLNASLNASDDLMLIHDPEGGLVYLNERAYAELNYDPDRLRQGLSLAEVLAPGTLARYDEEKASDQPSAGGFEGLFYTSKAERLQARFSMRAIASLEGTDHTLLVARPALPPDNDRPPAERDMAQFDHAPIGIVFVDMSGVVEELNRPAASMLGLEDPAQAEGMPLDRLIEDKDAQLRKTLQEGLCENHDTRLRFSGNTTAGTLLNCDIIVAPLRQAGAVVTGAAIYLVDATENTILHQNLLQTEKLSALGEIVAGVAHELNNPLTGILGYAQLLQSMETSEKMRSRLERISIEALRCRKIVQGLLGFSRHHESRESPQDLNEVLINILTLREYQMRVDNIAVKVDLGESLPLVSVDPHDMQQVFLNIINNAHQTLLQVTERARTFRVSSGVREGEVFIAFEDNGEGVPAEIQSKVFDPFFTTKDVGQGTGLGLSIAYGVVSKHGGRISLDSVEGEGTTLTIRFPLPAPQS